MERYRLKIAQRDFKELQRLVLADLPNEAGAFALVGVCAHAGSTDILVRRVIPIPRDCFRVQREYRLEVATRAINGLAALCERNGLGAVLCHSHPTDSPYSPSDDHGERRVFAALRPFMLPRAPAASLLIYVNGGRILQRLAGEECSAGTVVHRVMV